jgi:hypothetical protein
VKANVFKIRIGRIFLPPYGERPWLRVAKPRFPAPFGRKYYREQCEPGRGRTSGHRRRRFQPPSTGAADSFPSTEGTAILNLTSEQFQGIRKLLIGLRLGRSIADDVRAEIFGILTKGQRRVLGAAWFILSVRV